MINRETISARQMAMLYLTFASGSAMINIPAPLTGIAGNSAWISLIIAGVCGVVLLACILYLNGRYPGYTYVEYSRAAVGKWLSLVIGALFLFMVMIMISYITIDIGAFFNTTLMKDTPNYVFHFLILLTAALTARAGIEVMARMFNLLQFLVLVMIMGILILVSSYYKMENLFPVIPVEGVKPIVHGVYYTFGFPFAEVCLFAMLLPFVDRKKDKKLNRWMYVAYFANVLILSLAVICTILAVGPLSGEFKYSLYELARLINIGDFIERIESVIGLVLTLGSYMKATIALYILSLALARLLRAEDSRIFIFPLALISFFLTVIMFKNEAQFVEKVTVVWPMINLMATVAPILLITIAAWIRGKLNKT